MTKWLMEIAAGVYVGKVSARVRDKLWERVVESSKGGRAVLVYSAANEQRVDFRIHGETWEPIDFDGLKLMLRPSPARLRAAQEKRSGTGKLGFSNAAKFRKAKQYAKARQVKTDGGASDANAGQQTSESDKQAETGQALEAVKSAPYPRKYVVVDIETTGFKPSSSEITEIGALMVEDGEVTGSFQSLVKIGGTVPPHIVKLTGITDSMLAEQGRALNDVIIDLAAFVGNLSIVAHNAAFDLSFLNHAFGKAGLKPIEGEVIDTLKLARQKLKNLKSHKLQDLAKFFKLDLPRQAKGQAEFHRGIADCAVTHLVFQKLMNLP